MYTNEIRQKFIELRAQGLSLERVASQLGINKSTALQWHRRFQKEIAELKAFHFEAIRERVAAKYEDELEYAMGALKHIRTLLMTRGLNLMSINSLYYAEEMAFRRVRHLCALAHLPDLPFNQSSKPDPASPPPEGPLAEIPLPQDARPEGAHPEESQNPTKTQPFPHQNQGGRQTPTTNSSSENLLC
jgi:hypothetical protein